MAVVRCRQNGTEKRKSNVAWTSSGVYSEGEKMYLPSVLFLQKPANRVINQYAKTDGLRNATSTSVSVKAAPSESLLPLMKQFFGSICKEWDVPAYIERSRSGKGAHVWIFFADPVLATDARRLGFAIIGAAMENNARLDMKSYDRFLPNQDFLPKGGFGNLIALPLQGLARKSGNSVFVDESFEAFRNQWSLLSFHARLFST